MERRRPQRRIGNRNNRTGNTKTNKGSDRRTIRRRIVNRRRRLGQGTRRNRLERVEREIRNGPRNNRRRYRRFYQNRRRNNRLRKIFVGGLPRFVYGRELYNLFRGEGRILTYRIAYNRNGYSRGWGEIEFLNPRDAWRSIQKWNNTTYKGSLIRVEYRRRRRLRRNNNNNFRGRGYYGRGRGGYGGNRFRNYY